MRQEVATERGRPARVPSRPRNASLRRWTQPFTNDRVIGRWEAVAAAMGPKPAWWVRAAAAAWIYHPDGSNRAAAPVYAEGGATLISVDNLSILVIRTPEELGRPVAESYRVGTYGAVRRWGYEMYKPTFDLTPRATWEGLERFRLPADGGLAFAAADLMSWFSLMAGVSPWSEAFRVLLEVGAGPADLSNRVYGLTTSLDGPDAPSWWPAAKEQSVLDPDGVSYYIPLSAVPPAERKPTTSRWVSWSEESPWAANCVPGDDRRCSNQPCLLGWWLIEDGREDVGLLLESIRK